MSLADVLEPTAVGEPFARCQQADDLRQTLRCAHQALVESADADMAIIRPPQMQATAQA